MKLFTKILLAALLVLPGTAWATTSVPWSITNLTDTFIFPNLVNGSAKGVLISASSTVNSTLSVSTLVTGNCVQAGAGGLLTTIVGACGSSSGVTAVTGSYPILSTGGTTPNISTAFGTTTNWGIGTNGFLVFGPTGIPFSAASSTLNLPNSALQNSSVTVNGTGIALGASGTITAASSTLLADSNTFSGTLNKFSNAPALAITGLIKGNGSSAITAAVNGTDFTLITAKTCTAGDFVSSVTAAGVFTCTTPAGTTYTGTYPIIVTGSVISTAFGTTSSNTFAATQTFTNSPVFSTLGAGTVNSTAAGTVYNTATSTPTVSAPITYSGTLGQFISGISGAFGCTTASAGVTGCLSGTDYNTFNGKENVLSFIWPLIRSTNTITFGGLSTTTNLTQGFLPYVTGVNTFGQVATTTVSCAGTASCTSFVAIGASPITITGTGGTVTSVTGTYPILSTGGATPVISTAFGTTSTIGVGNNLFLYTNANGVIVGAASSSLSLPNTALQNSSITVNGSAISLGGSATITANTTNALTFNNSGVGAASGTTFNGGSAQTISYNTVGAQVAGTYVTAITVASTNGFAGSSSGGATPALTLSTTITGLLKGNGTAISAATPGTDYDVFAWPFTPINGTSVSTSSGLVITASSTIGNGTQANGLTIAGGATTTGNEAVLGSTVIGTSTGALSLINANNGNLFLYNTNTSGSSPALVMGGNNGGDTDFWFARTNNNDTANNDSLQVGAGLVPGTSPVMTWNYLGNEGIGSTSPFATLSIHANPTDLSIKPTLFAVASSTSSATTTLFNILNTGNVGLSTTSPWARLAVDTSNLASGVPSFAVGSSTRTDFVVTQSGNIGIGTANPAFFLSAQKDGLLVFLFQAANSVGPVYASRQSNGTNASPVSTATGDTLGRYDFNGYNSGGPSYGTAANITIAADTGWSSTASDDPGKITFGTSPDGAGVPLPRLTINAVGNVGVGSTTPFGLLSVGTNNIGNFIISTSTSGQACFSSIGELYSGTCGGGSYPFTPSTDGGINTSATSTPIQGTHPGLGLDVSNTSWYGLGGQTLAYASSTNGVTLFGLNAGGNAATTSATTYSLTAIGFNAAAKMTTSGLNNTAIGASALAAAIASSNNTAVGVSALAAQANGSGSSNVAVGSSALLLMNGALGKQSVAVGASALAALVNAGQDTAIGYNALLNATGGLNVAVGYNAGIGNNSGTNNTIIGASALAGTAAAVNNNIAIGENAASAGFAGSNNVIIGLNGGAALTGSDNIIIGNYTFLPTSILTAGAGNIGLGNNVTFPSSTGLNQLNIGNLIFGILPATSTAFVLPTSGSIGIGTSSPFAKFSIHTNNGDTNNVLFAIGSSTQTATTTLIAADNTGALSFFNTLGSWITKNINGNLFFASSTSLFNATSTFADPNIGYIEFPNNGGCVGCTDITLSGGINLRNGIYVNATSSAITANVFSELYTAPTGRRALAASMYTYNGTAGTINYRPYIKSSGIYYAVGATTSVSAGVNGANSNMVIVLEPGESFSVLSNTSAVNITANLIEYDASVPFKSIRAISPTNATSTLYTAPTGVSASVVSPSIFNGATFGNAVLWNNSTNVLSIKFYRVKSGQTAVDGLNTIHPFSTSEAGANVNTFFAFPAAAPGILMNSGDSIQYASQTSLAGTGSLLWITVYEH